MFEFLPDDPKELIAYAIAGTTLAGLVAKAIHKVEEGERGVRTRNGKTHRTRGKREGEPYGVLEPGLHLSIPLTHSIKNANVKHRTSQLKDALFSNEDQYWKADVSVTWAVRADGDNPIKSLFEVEHGELDDTVKEICSDGLDRVFKGHAKKPIEDFAGIKKDAIEICNPGLLNYGVSVQRFNIYNPTPRDPELVKQAVSIGGTALSQLIAQSIDSGGSSWFGVPSS